MPTFAEMEELRRQGKIGQSTFDTFAPALAPAPVQEQPLPVMEDPSLVPAEPEFVPTDTGVQLGPDPITPEPTVIPDPVIPEPNFPKTKDVVTGETQTITTQEKKVTEGARQAQQELQDSIEADRQAQQNLLQIDQEKAAEAANINQEARRIETEFGAKEQELRNQGQEEIQSQLDEIDNKVEEFSNRKYEGYWNNKSTGTKILGAISLALGAYGSSLGGGPNTALTIINKAMDDDFRNFQAVTSTKLKAISQSRLSTEKKRQFYKDQISTLQAKKISDIKVVQNKLNDISNKFAAPEAKAKIAEMNAQLDQKAAQARSQFEGSLTETVNTSIQRKVSTMKVDPKTGQVVTPITKELRKRQVPGVGIALTEADAKELKKAVVTKKDLDSKLAELIALRQEKGGEFMDREAVARGKQLSKELLLKYKDMAKLGVLSESDMAIIEKIIPADPLQFDLVPGQEPTMVKLQQLQKDVDGLFNAELDARLESREESQVKETVKQPAPASGQIVKQNGKTYEWDGSQYVEVK